MFDFVRNAKDSIADTMRRTALKIGAVAVIAIGAGFLLAALWTFLAVELGWGSMPASLTIGAVFVVLGIIVIMMSGKKKHEMPTTDDLRNEIEARVEMVADATIGRVRSEATKFADLAENRFTTVIDGVGDKVSRFTSGVEKNVYSFATETADKVGLTADNLHSAKETAQDYADKAKDAANSNAGSMAKLIGAFAVGVTVASKLQEMRHSHQDILEFDDDFDDDIYLDDDDLYLDDRYA